MKKYLILTCVLTVYSACMCLGQEFDESNYTSFENLKPKHLYQLKFFGSEKTEIKFEDPVVLALSSNLLFVFDEGNGQLAIFDHEGSFLKQGFNSGDEIRGIVHTLYADSDKRVVLSSLSNFYIYQNGSRSFHPKKRGDSGAIFKNNQLLYLSLGLDRYSSKLAGCLDLSTEERSYFGNPPIENFGGLFRMVRGIALIEETLLAVPGNYPGFIKVEIKSGASSLVPIKIREFWKSYRDFLDLYKSSEGNNHRGDPAFLDLRVLEGRIFLLLYRHRDAELLEVSTDGEILNYYKTKFSENHGVPLSFDIKKAGSKLQFYVLFRDASTSFSGHEQRKNGGSVGVFEVVDSR